MTNKIKIEQPRYKMSLSCDEIDKLYAADLEILKRRLPHKMGALRRKLIKAISFPVNHIIREKVGKEEIRAYSVVEHKRQPDKKFLPLETVVYFKNSRGLCAYINCDPYEIVKDQTRYGNGNFGVSHRYLFTPHFFERYEMRHGLENGFSDIHDQFFLKNMTPPKHRLHTALCKSRPNDYKTIDVWSLCDDGLMLGQIMGSEEKAKEEKQYVMQINTFLDLDTLTKRQDECRDILEVVKEYFKDKTVEDFIDSIAKRAIITQIKKL